MRTLRHRADNWPAGAHTDNVWQHWVHSPLSSFRVCCWKHCAVLPDFTLLPHRAIHLVNSHSPFNTQLKYHFLRAAFPALPVLTTHFHPSIVIVLGHTPVVTCVTVYHVHVRTYPTLHRAQIAPKNYPALWKYTHLFPEQPFTHRYPISVPCSQFTSPHSSPAPCLF